MKEELITKQDTLVYEWNKEKDCLDVLWILETEDGKYYQKVKSINVKKVMQ